MLRSIPLLSDSSQMLIPLKSLSLQIHIKHSISTTTFIQSFTNSTSGPLECEYELPFLKDSLISSLAIQLPDGSSLHSVVEEKEKALESYQDSVAEGKCAIFGQVENNFAMLIGNILPGQTVVVSVAIVGPLKTKDNEWRYELLTGFLPETKLGYNVNAEILIESSSLITNYSSNWNIHWTFGTQLSGRFDPGFCPENELWVHYSAEDSHLPTCYIQRFNDKFAAMISFIPKNDDAADFNSIEGTGDYIILIDRSGSMDGERIKLAKNAAILFLKSLPTVSLFNVVSFGSEAVKMFENSVYSDSEIVNKAINTVSAMNADMGGTNIYDALNKAILSEGNKEFPRTLFLITDGGDDNSQSSLKIIAENSKECCVHTIGINSSKYEYEFLIQAAQAGKGEAFYVANIQELGKKVIKALSLCILPCLSNIQINWTGDMMPKNSQLGRTFYGERFYQYILMDSQPETLPQVTYFDTYQQASKSINIKEITQLEGTEIFKLWSNLTIKELNNDSDIITLSKFYQVPSKLTGFFCVLDQEATVVSDATFVKIPIQQVRKKEAVEIDSERCFDEDDEEECEELELLCEMDELSYTLKPQIAEEEKAEPIFLKESNSKNLSIYYQVISKVDNKGFWNLNDVLVLFPQYSALRVEHSELEDNIFATLLILAYLSKNHIDLLDEWTLLRKKSFNWLSKSGITLKSATDISEELKILV